MSRIALIAAVAAAGVSLQSGNAQAGATLAAEYLFNNTLNSDVAGAPALTAVDPQAQSGFVTDNAFPLLRTVPLAHILMASKNSRRPRAC